MKITCSKCKKEKDETEFPVRKGTPTGRRKVCRECYRTYRRGYYEKNIERERENRRLSSKRNGHHGDKWSNILRNYGLTKEQWENMYKEQDGKCYICGEHRPLCVDHDHKTGEVRHLLCSQCNSMLGLAKEDINILAKAIDYLKE